MSARGEVVILGQVLVHVVKFPIVGIEIGEHVGGNGRAEDLPDSLNDGPGHGHTARQPSW